MRHRRTELPATILICTCVMMALTERAIGGDTSPDRNASAAQVFEGDFVLHREIPVGLVAGTRDHPRLVEVEWVRVEAVYGNAWGLTARVGWSPAAEATWQIKVELLDDEGRVLRHSRDEATVFTGKAGTSDSAAMHFAELELDAMQFEGRRHASKVRVRLEPVSEPAPNICADESAKHRLEIAVVDEKSQQPMPQAAVVVRAVYGGRKRSAFASLYTTNEQGTCQTTLTKANLISVRVTVQKDGYTTLQKGWSRPRSFWATALVPLEDLPERHSMEMPPAQAIGGIVQDPDGRPIAGVEVRISASLEQGCGRADISRTVHTDRDGSWRAGGIPSEIGHVLVGLKHPEYLSDTSYDRQVAAESLLAARAFKHVEVMSKGLTVSGVVLDERGRSVSHAAVILAPRRNGWFRYDYACRLTDASGRFRFDCGMNDRTDTTEDGVITGVLVEAPGYTPAMQQVIVEPNLAPLEFHLKSGRTLMARVLDSDGRPIAGAWTVVSLLPEDPSYGLWLDDTDEQGRFQVPDAPDNDLRCTVGKKGYVTIRDYAFSGAAKEPVMRMRPAPRVAGGVQDSETDTPIPNFEVAAVYVSGGRTVTRDPVPFTDGRYELVFEEAVPETVQLRVSALGYTRVTSGAIDLNRDTHTMDFTLAQDPSFNEQTSRRERGTPQSTGPRVIEGVVRDPNGRPVPNIAVVTHPPIAPEAITDAEGKFKLRCRPELMRPGDGEAAHVIVRDLRRNLAAAVELDEAITDALVVELAPGVALSGTVTDVEGKAIPNVKLSLTFWGGEFGYSAPETARPDPDGCYEIRALPPGYRHSVNATADGYGSEYVSAHTGEAVDGRMTLEPMILQVADLDIAGVVVDVEDKPVSGARVACEGRGQPRREVRTDKEGGFTLRNVCAGRIRVYANVRNGSSRLYGSVQTEGGATDIKIVVGPRDSNGRFIPAKPPSLTGKPLPPLKDLGAEPPASSYKDKIVLLCFFDMNQRPSRHCLSTLAKRAQDLKQRGVTIIGVQAAEADANALAQWLKEQGITVPVGSIKGDARKAAFAWGVQSLPWLILTDPQHTVRAEGFSMDEMAKHLKSVAGD